MMGFIEVIGLVIALIGGYLLYAYVNFREKEEKKIRNFFVIEKKKGAFIYTVIMFVMSLIIGVYGRYMNGYSAFMAYLNIAMLFLLAAMAWVDFKEKIIPNSLILVGLVFWLIQLCLEVVLLRTDIKQVLMFSGLGCIWGVLMVFIAFVAKASLGMGDAKMFFVIGLIYGINQTYSILLVSLFIMAIISVVLLLLKKVDRKTAVPMAPFVLAGYVLCIFLGM